MRTINPWRGLAELHRRGLRLGTDIDTRQTVFLPLKRLETHLHLLGPPGTGKTRLLLHVFQLLCELQRATVVVLNPKGGFGRQARDAAIGAGLSHRLIWFDPGEPSVVMGYNPLRPNRLPAATHAKAVREAIRAGWGQASFDATPQMARLLFLMLFTARELHLDLVETLALLRSPSAPAFIRQLHDEALRAALAYFWSLGASRRDELAASALARLESFVLDPVIRAILTAPAGLQLDQVLTEHKILIVNLEQYRPLRADDVKLLGRFIINDLLSHVFAREPRERTPVYLVLDEAHTFATADLCTALDQGRELKLCCVLAHQHLGQLRQEDVSGQLLSSVMQCARTKLVFGGLSAQDLGAMAPDLFIEDFDPWEVKDELSTLELEPVESRRTVRTTSRSKSTALGFGLGGNWTTGRTVSQARARGVSVAEGETTASGFSQLHSHTSGRSVGDLVSGGHASGLLASTATGQVFPEDGGVLTSPLTTSIVEGGATSDVDFSGEARTEAELDADTDGEAWTETHAEHRSRAVHHSEARATASSTQAGVSVTAQRSVTNGRAESEAEVPFYEYNRRRVVSSRTFLSQDEFLTLKMQRLKQQRTAHFVLKRPSRPARFVQAPHVVTPNLTERRRQRGLAQVFAAPCYTPRQALAPARALPPADFRSEDVWEDANSQLIPLKEVDDPKAGR